MVTSYTYLGVQIDDAFSFTPAQKSLNKHMQQLKHKLQMTWALKLPARAKLRAWQSLIVSRLTYGMTLLAAISDKMAEALHTLWYRALKGLINIKGNPKKDAMIKQIFGISAERFQELLANQQSN